MKRDRSFAPRMPKRILTSLLTGIMACAIFFAGRATAQSELGPWHFVRTSDGAVWVLLNNNAGKLIRVAVPIHPATEEELAVIPHNGQWIIPKDDGTVGPKGGPRPDWDLGYPQPAVAAPQQTMAPQPEPSIMPTPIPASPSTRRIGDTTTLTSPSGLRILVTVNAIEDNAKPGRYDSPAQGRYVVVDWTLKNEGNEDLSVNRLDFKLQTSDGYIVERADAIVREPDLNTTTLGPGQLVRGWLTYDVPAGKNISSAIYQPGRTRQFVIAEVP